MFSLTSVLRVPVRVIDVSGWERFIPFKFSKTQYQRRVILRPMAVVCDEIAQFAGALQRADQQLFDLYVAVDHPDRVDAIELARQKYILRHAKRRLEELYIELESLCATEYAFQVA
jgi:hypothetical protein